ncbi:SRPBCC family protein [Nocardia transvalensis]|uniref:SRPBCC family protein n=1 Tax=Nocardia transvalensis TaxID=37333 RepID=UPI001896337B|nr:SRPBCC family protein [Nocardia transvalensis]MBF6331647.1 SRPBCC family protein [Nocardia transvalensis]
MTRWFALQSCDEKFFETAPFRFPYDIDLPTTAEDVWGWLTAARPLQGCRLLSDISWTSPLGPQATRVARLFGGRLTMRERFFRWEEGRRYSFTTEAATLPLFRRFAEDCLIEPTPTGSRFTWTFAFQPRPELTAIMRLGTPLSRLMFDSFARDARRHFANT